MNRRLNITLLLIVLTACGSFSPPPRFPQLNERPITDRGSYALPQWSPDGKYLAFISDSTNKAELEVYGIASERRWTVASGIALTYFDWVSEDRLAYLSYRPEQSGSPFPEVYDLHLVDITGESDRVVVNRLYSPGNFAWLADGRGLAALLSTADSDDGNQDVYLMNTTTGKTELLVSHKEFNTDFVALSLSSDKTTLAAYGVRKESDRHNLELLMIYDIETRAMTHAIVPDQVFSKVTLHGDRNFGWVGDKMWVMAKGDVPEGECCNYALFFFDINDLSKSFCIPTVKGVIAAPDLSPDLSHVAFLNVADPGAYFVMIADLTPEYRSRLEP